MMSRGCLLFLLSAVFVVALAKESDLVNDELINRVSEEIEWEGELGRSLIGIEATGELGSRCSIFNPCNPGYECWHQRCIPGRDCLKQKMEEFDKTFDQASYKKMIFQKSGVSEEDIMLAYEESDHDDVTFVKSKTMQALIATVQENWEPFEPVSEIIDRCKGVIRGTRRQLEKTTIGVRTLHERRPTPQVEDTPTDNGIKERRLSSPTTSPSASPSLSAAPSSVPSSSLQPSSPPSLQPSLQPSMAPTETITTCYFGIHLEAGIIFEISLSILWRMGLTNTDTYVRGCAGFELGGGLEFLSFIAIIAETPLANGIACGSFLWENDVGFIFNLGFGIGVCFTPNNFVYYEFTIGGGFGGGQGYNVCGVLTLPAGGRDCEEGEECSEIPPLPDSEMAASSGH